MVTMMILFDDDDGDCEDGDNCDHNRKVRLQNEENMDTMRPKGIVRGHHDHENDLDLCDKDLAFDYKQLL